MKKDIWIAGITRGHNGGVCLLKNGEVVFSVEEERISRHKYDGTPFATMLKILDYTDKLDYLVIAHTSNNDEMIMADYSGENMYTSLARKLKLIETPEDMRNHPQVIKVGNIHHKLHAACAFYRSGFESAVAVIVDGAGSHIQIDSGFGADNMGWEVESIFDCSYPNSVKTMYKHIGCISPTQGRYFVNAPGEMFGDEDGHEFELLVTDRAGIVKTYEAATYYCGWNFIEAGKTMGLSPYGEESEEFDDLFDNESGLSNRNLVVPTYPMGAHINFGLNTYLNNHWYKEDLTELENRRNIAYAVQKGSQKAVLNLIRKAVTMSGNKNVVLSGGYGLNCVANYYYLEELKDEGINLYVEPISSDAGTAMGAALLIWHDLDNSSKINYSADGLYLGFKYDYSDKEITSLAEKYNATISSTSYNEIVDIITNKNIVAMFQGSAESGPRALGNRSILYDPTDPNGKDHVNKVKRREYFRPFAGTILAEDVHDWFDLRGMKDSPYMMYAVNCQPGVEEKIPSIIHVDGTCRIQTVTEEQNYHYYNLIKSFKEKTDCPIIFNTSFNLGGEPLVEDLDDALRTLANSDIEYLFLPEYNKLITIKN